MVVGMASGCGTLFSYNGRHPVLVEPVVPGTPVRKTFPAKAGKHYTLAVHVVFEREGLPEVHGQTFVEAQFPLSASIEDTSGVAVAKAVGWLDPNEAPTVLYGQTTSAHQRRPIGVGPAELVAERLVGPFAVQAARDVAYTVDLGADRLAKASVKEARIVLYDDTLPTSMTVAFVAAAAGALVLVTGLILLLSGLLRSRRGGHRRPQIV
jgi:hypothetical protein